MLQRIANPIQPFGLIFVEDSLVLPLLDGLRDGFGNQTDLPDQLDNCHMNQF